MELDAFVIIEAHQVRRIVKRYIQSTNRDNKDLRFNREDVLLMCGLGVCALDLRVGDVV